MDCNLSALTQQGQSHRDSEWHEGDQKPTTKLYNAGELTLQYRHRGTLYHSVSAEQRDHSHLGQTHTAHHKAA